MKKSEKEFGHKVRILMVMHALLDRPNHYTRRKLAERHQVTPKTITNDFQALATAGFVVKPDDKNRYAFVEDKPYQQLKDLLHFSEEDQALLYRAIDQVASTDERGQRLKKKLAALYDYHRLGHAYLRKPYLAKVDLLLQAKNEKRQVILRDYSSSNSNEVKDRVVEPFHPSPPDDTLQAFDVEKRELRHYRISRITRVELTDQPWQFTGHHNIMLTDPFRIVDSQQVMVHLRLKVGARNELIERFPLTQAYIQDTEEEGIYDFQCMVNHRFLGLSNFVLGFYHQLVEVVCPDHLLTHLRSEIQKMQF